MTAKAPREDIINHTRESDYVYPAEAAVREKLEWFRDRKLALMTHFGGYSQLGICESWPLSDGDAYWSRKGIDWEKDPGAFRKQYFDLNKSFNPLRFDADEWARQAEDAGCGYMIFTTKHHDGFCLFDTRETDYKSTAPDCPYSVNKNANIARRLFDALRRRNIGVAAYFSKPDWHCPWYWAEGCEKPVAFDRNPTYRPEARPELWDAFRRFARAQILELARDYGPLDILWLDGGQVRPQNGQDLRMYEIAAEARRISPGLIIADRTVGGEFENYITPEQAIPDSFIAAPWESCVTVGTGFAFKFCDQYKSSRQLARMLIEVVAKGGNLALGVGAQPDGRLPRGAIDSMTKLGDWLKENGRAVYKTRARAPYVAGGWAKDGANPDFGFTQASGSAFALHPLREGEKLGETMALPWTDKAESVTLVSTGEKLAFAREDERLIISVPERMRGGEPLAIAFEILE